MEGLLEDPMVAIAALIGLAVILSIWTAVQYYKIPTLSTYKELHPNARDGKGVPTCFSCKTTSIYLQNAHQSSGRVHICRICGTKLWRS